MKTEGNKEEIAYLAAKKQYLVVSKRYSALLSRIMDLDPNVLKIAEEIMVIGDGLSVYDNRFITTFYNELKAKSKIDKKYYELLLELKRTKSELDNAVTVLSRGRILYFLRKAGIPPKRTNHNKDVIVSQINNPNIGLLEKISLPGILGAQESESMEELLAGGELVCESGDLIPKTKSAREFVRKLEKEIRQNVNDEYLLGKEMDLLKFSGKINKENLLEFIRMSADNVHAREIEKKIDTGDLSLASGQLIPVTPKGGKYLALLIEELALRYEGKLKDQQLAGNRRHSDTDPRLCRISGAMSDLDIKLDRHKRLSSLASHDNSYKELVARATNNKDKIKKTFVELMTLQETLSSAFADVKKQLLSVANRFQVDIDKLLSLMMAVKYLSVYENKYEAKLTELEGILGIAHANTLLNSGPESLTRLVEKYADDVPDYGEEISSVVRETIIKQLSARQDLGAATSETLIQFLLNSPEIREYKRVVVAQQATRKHVVDALSGSTCLYQGLGNISEILAELTELEIEKKEKIADLTHEIELAHKELWLARITNNNQSYVDSNFMDLPEETRAKAITASKQAIAGARKEIRDTLAKYRKEHKKHGDDFASELRRAFLELSKGGDVSEISAHLKKKYKQLTKNHEGLTANMEKDIVLIEKRLLDFEEKAPANLEKLLISDVRTNI